MPTHIGTIYSHTLPHTHTVNISIRAYLEHVLKTDSNLARLDHHQGHPDHWTSQVVDHFNHQGKRFKVFVM